MNKIYLSLAISLCAIIFGVGWASAEGKVSLIFSPVEGEYRVGDTLKFGVYVYPHGDTVDTVRANLYFSPDILEITNVSKDASFSFSAAGNVLDNSNGILSFGSGLPGGTTEPSRFITVKFKAKKEGVAKVILNTTSLTLSDGENKFDNRQAAALFKIVKTPETKPAPKQEAKPKTAAKPKTETKVFEPELAMSTTTSQVALQDYTVTSSTSTLDQTAPPSEETDQGFFTRRNIFIIAAVFVILIIIGLFYGL